MTVTPPSRRTVAAASLAGLAACVATATPALAKHKAGSATTSTTTTATGAAPVTATAPLRLAAAKVAVADSSARLWKSDADYAVGGRLDATTSGIARTSSPQLYQHARLGGSGYRIPVGAPGTYFVDMFTAEWQGRLPGQRVWNVTAEGHRVATSVDAAASAGPQTAWHVMFAVPVTDGQLDLDLDSVAGSPLVGAVAVTYQSAATTPSTVFEDDFDGAAGSSPDPAKWNLNVGGNGWGNSELEYYTARTDNAALDGAGHLAITALHQPYTGADGVTRQYTSARLDTARHFTMQYGTLEARMKVPAGQGLWPAFWALGSNVDTAGWPLCGEIDVMENVGKEPNTVHAALHAGVSGGGSWLSGNQVTDAAPISDGYHTYSTVWGPNGISIAMDGVTYLAVDAVDAAPGSLWNFNHPFSPLLNLAVGGSWPGSPDETTQFPAVMSVDYVRATS